VQDKLIICDWLSEEYVAGSPPEVLRTALLEWDRGRAYPAPPLLLRGGFEQFRLAHPHLVTDPKVRAPPLTATSAMDSMSSEPPSLAGIEYPNLDVVSCFLLAKLVKRRINEENNSVFDLDVFFPDPNPT
jgi:hypothetical protein